MSHLSEAFKNCYLVHYYINPDKTMQVVKAFTLVELSNEFNGKFLGAKGSSRYGIRFSNNATHIGVFDLSDPENPIKLTAMPFEDIEVMGVKLVKSRDAYIIIRRGDKNYKFTISEHETKQAQKKALLSTTKKQDPQTLKVNQSLKNFKNKKATS